MEIKPSYKQTEIGVIPEDWVASRVSEVFSFKQGFQCPVDKQSSVKRPGFVRFIRIIDVTQKNEAERYILDPGDQYHVKENGLFMIRYGVPGMLGYGYSGVIANNMFMLIALKQIDSLYFYYMLQTQQDSILNLSSSTTMAAVNFQSLRELMICHPNDIVEQNAIANALSDIDSLITSLEKLIEKKKLIKQGVMQELLTGKRRLPGFSGEWETKRLGTFCAHITTGRKDVNEGNPNGKYPFYTCSRAVTFSDHYSFDTEAILIAGNGDVGTLHYFTGKFEAYQRTYVLSGFNVNARYLVHYLNMNLVPTLCDSKIGTSIPYIKIGDLINMPVLVPMDDEELEYITSVLDDIESDIDMLELQLYKQVLLKQAMMQELLTGRIRLI